MKGVRALPIVLMLTATVSADAPSDAGIHAGTELAGQGRFKEAIVQFKAARTAAPDRPEPNCMIALAYSRLERWGQARLFLGRCMQFAWRPGWLKRLVAAVDDAIAQGGLTEVTFVLTPANAQIALASFEPDETFTPQPIFVEPGKQLVTISAPGFTPQKLAIDVPAAGPYEVRAELLPDAEQLPPPPGAVQSPSRPSPQVEPSVSGKTGKTGTYVVVASAGIVAVGVAAHVAMALTRSNLTSDGTRSSAKAYNDGIGTFDRERDVAIGAYALGAIGLAVGAWLWHGEVAPIVAPHAAGVAWSASW
jgi:hypothetical protein